MRVCVFLNPKAGSATALDALRAAIAERGWTLREPADAAAFSVQLTRAAREGFERIALAGGDGTVHVAVNVLAKLNRVPPLAVNPLGTGNDFARTLCLPLDAMAALDLVALGRVRRVDAVVVSGDANMLMINAATGGFAGQVTANLPPERKRTWGPLSYLREAATVAADPPRWTVTYRRDGGRERRLDAINVVIANGRTSGGGIAIAPTASVEDGRFDVLLVTAATALDRTVVSARVLAGDYDRDECVQVRRARRLELRCEPAMPFSIDGEECSGTQFLFELRRKAAAFVVGPDYRRHQRRIRGLMVWLVQKVSGLFRWVRRQFV